MTLPVNPTYRQFFDAVLIEMKIIPTHANRRALGVIAIVEGVNHYWNPMNWVLPTGRGFKNWNAIGVKMYPDPITGEYWTAQNLLTNPRWHDVVTQLKTAKTRTPILDAFNVQYASWGAHIDFSKFTTRNALDRLDMVMQG